SHSVNDHSPCETTPASINSKSASSDQHLDQFLIDFVVERTGYPRDVVELDADLESDLGIDSIAKVQLIGEIQDQYALAIDETATRSAFSELRTLRQIRDLINSSARRSSGVSISARGQSNDVSPNNNGHTDRVDHEDN